MASKTQLTPAQESKLKDIWRYGRTTAINPTTKVLSRLGLIEWGGGWYVLTDTGIKLAEYLFANPTPDPDGKPETPTTSSPAPVDPTRGKPSPLHDDEIEIIISDTPDIVASAPACDHCHASKDTVRTVYHNGTPVMQVCTDCIIDPVIPVAESMAWDDETGNPECNHDFQLRDIDDEYVECTICGATEPIDGDPYDAELLWDDKIYNSPPIAEPPVNPVWTHSTAPTGGLIITRYFNQRMGYVPVAMRQNRAISPRSAFSSKPMKVTQPNMQRRSKPLERKQRPVKPVISIAEVLRQMGIGQAA